MTPSSQIETILGRFFISSIKNADRIDTYYGDLWRELYRLHKAGGKRLRPRLTLMAYEAFGGKDTSSMLQIAAAQELIHFSMLIHDDIIDRDTVRYGVNNIIGSYEKVYGPFAKDDQDVRHYANSAAIMAGDLMIAGAHKLILDSPVDDSKKMIALQTMYDGIFDVAGGELLDTESSFRPMGAVDPIKIAIYKTASYSFSRPLTIGAHLADAPAKSIKQLARLASNLGIAYQLSDDLLGVFGDQTKTGKSNTGDIREGKQTLLASLTLELLSKSQKASFEEYFGNKSASDNELERIKKLMVASGAKRTVQDHVRTYLAAARNDLTKLGITGSSRNEFIELIDRIASRQY